MIKKILTGLFISSIFLFSGCGDDEGESRLSTQQMLDNGEYNKVITKLDDKAEKSDSDYLALAAAYMGRAGVSLPDLVDVVSSNNNDGDGEFSSFVNDISLITSASALLDLEKATAYYEEVVDDNCSGEIDTILSDSQKDICLFIGLSSTTKVAVTIDLITEDISALSNSGVQDEQLKASTCAMQYALDGGSDVNVNEECRGNIVENSDVTFEIIEKTYTPLTITLNGREYYYLMTEAITGTNSKQTVVTRGYCTAIDFSTRYIPQSSEEYEKPNDYYACPINEVKDEEELTVIELLVDVLNEGIDSITSAASEDMQADIDEFKEEIKDSSSSEDITEQDIIDYLNRKNN